MADPTVEFLKSLKDESRWKIRRGIPIFEPHERGEIEVTKRDLEEIAEESNRLLREKGVAGKLTDIHTIRPRPDGKGMEPCPNAKLLGFQLNYRVGTYGTKKTPCILADWYLYPEHASKADRSPHRSVEYQHNAKIIRGTAVMMNDPYLDMGIVVFGSGNESITCYSMGAAMEPEAKTEPEYTPEEEKLFAKCAAYMAKMYTLTPKTKEGEAEDPAMKKPKEEKKPDVQPFSKDNGIAVYQAQVTALQNKLEALQLERDHESCKQMLAVGLVGYSLTEDEQKREFAKLCKTPASDRAERVTELKKIYADRLLPSGKIDVYAGHVEPGSVGVTSDPHRPTAEHEAAMTYMRQNPGMTYDVALSKVKK